MEKSNENTKLLFFDIDGTLIPIGGEMQQSTRLALTKAQQAGHKIFIATGRSKCQIPKDLLELGVDGWVCATGGYAEYHGKIIHHEYFTKQQIKTIVKILDDTNASFVEQGFKEVVLPRRSIAALGRHVGGENDHRLAYEFLDVFGRWRFDDDTKNYYKTHALPESYCFCEADATRDGISKLLPKDTKVLPPSFMILDENAGEIMLKNVSKMSAINKIAKELGVKNENLYAFGDGENDLEMMQGCGVSVAMENATLNCKKAADFITTDQHNDGIYNALKHLRII